jgi:hypothetical protein
LISRLLTILLVLSLILVLGFLPLWLRWRPLSTLLEVYYGLLAFALPATFFVFSPNFFGMVMVVTRR